MSSKTGSKSLLPFFIGIQGLSGFLIYADYYEYIYISLEGMSFSSLGDFAARTIINISVLIRNNLYKL